MVDITDPIDTLIALLKDGSSGLGTTGYEITDDNSTAVSILITYKLSIEELKSQFGGSNDYDLIITVEKGEIEDKWIGLSTKQWTVPVILTLYLIDKWSAVGSSNKYLTASLVRYKAENAIRKFIKAKTLTAGGSIHTWTAKTFKEEEDKSIRPIVYKAIIVTETWTYYNPSVDYTVDLTSEENDASTSNLGSIQLIATSYSPLPDSATVDKGSHYLEFTPPSLHRFVSWEVSGSVTVDGETSNPTAAIVAGSGGVNAIYDEGVDQLDGNGGFEDGTLAPGENEQVEPCGNSVTVTTDNPYEGTYAVKLPSAETARYLLTFGVYFTASQILNFLIKARSQGATGTMTLKLGYSDATETEWTENLTSTYSEIDLLSHMAVGKSLATLRIFTSDSAYVLMDGFIMRTTL